MSGQQHSHPSVPFPKPRSGPIIVGAVSSSTSSSSTATTTAAASITSSEKVHSVIIGRYANESLSILGSFASSIKNDTKKRKSSADCIDDIERLIPPLFLCAGSYCNGNYESSKRPKKISEAAENGGETHDEAGVDYAEQLDKESDHGANNNADYRKQLQKELNGYKEQNQLLMKRRSNVLKSMVALHELYETGLDGIARLNDLRFVPDNVMPDKIPR